MKKKTSIGTWAYIWGGYEDEPIPLPTVIERLAALNFDGLEFGAYSPHLPPDDHTKEDRREIKKMLDDHGLGISGIATDFPSPATAAKNEYVDVVKRRLEICADFNSPKLRVDIVDPPTEIPGGMDYETCFSKVAETWNSAAELCQQQNVKLIWEFEPGFFFNKPSEVVRMVYAVDHPNFSTLFDSCHAYMCAVIGSRQLGEKEILPEGVVQFAHMLTGKIGHIHLIDSDGTLHDGETSTHAPLGTGVLDFDAIMPAIKDAGYEDEWWSIDLCFWAQALEVTADNKRYLDGLIKKFE